MKIHCPNCGKEIENLKKFCKYCGYEFSNDDKEQIEDYKKQISDYKWQKWQTENRNSNFEKMILIKIGIITVIVIIMCILLSGLS